MELQKFPKVSVKAVFRCGDYVLYYKTDNGIKDIPGGHIEFGETIFEALKRELNEEIEFELTFEPDLIHAWTYLSRDGSAHRVYIVYLIDLPEKTEFKSREYSDAIEFIWVHRDDINDQDIMSQQKELLVRAINHSK